MMVLYVILQPNFPNIVRDVRVKRKENLRMTLKVGNICECFYCFDFLNVICKRHANCSFPVCNGTQYKINIILTAEFFLGYIAGLQGNDILRLSLDIYENIL